MSDLENGKPKAQIGKVIEVLEQLGYEPVYSPDHGKLLHLIKEELDGKLSVSLLEQVHVWGTLAG